MGETTIARPDDAFNYDEIDAATTTYLKENALETRGLLKRTTEDIVKIGQNLLEAKARLPHGQFIPWVKAELGISQSTAWRFMQVAQGKEIGIAKAAAFIAAPKDSLETYKDLMSQVAEMPEFHDVTKIIPAMQPREYAGLVEDIKRQGLLLPIVTHQGKILDGRMRYLACRDAGVLPQFVPYTGKDSRESLLRYIIGVNIKRSHWTEDQLAVIAVRAEELEERLAAEGQAEQKSFTVNDLVEPGPDVDEKSWDSLVKRSQEAIEEMNAAMNGASFKDLVAIRRSALGLQNAWAEVSIRLARKAGQLLSEPGTPPLADVPPPTILEHGKRIVGAALEMARDIEEVSQKLSKAQFRAWVEAELNMDEQTALEFVIYARLHANNSVDDLPEGDIWEIVMLYVSWYDRFLERGTKLYA